jgi:hypothetical protein
LNFAEKLLHFGRIHHLLQLLGIAQNAFQLSCGVCIHGGCDTADVFALQLLPELIGITVQLSRKGLNEKI